MAWGYRYGFWKPYVPVWKRRQRAEKEVKEMARKGHSTDPVVIEGRTIATTYWGKAWCENLERYSDYENRLPRGRTYVRNGSVIDLQISPGRVSAFVSGSEIYTTSVELAALSSRRWRGIKAACAGKIDSVVELLEGKLSRGVMEVLTAEGEGLFPTPQEIEMKCSCPDWADMCKHVAAVLYGVGARLDSRPELLFVLRGVDQAELVGEIAAGTALVGQPSSGQAMDSSEMERLFDIEIDSETREKRAGRKAAGRMPKAARGAPRPRRGRPLPGSDGRPKTAPHRLPVAELNKLPDRRKRAGAREALVRGGGSLESRMPLLRRHFRSRFALTSMDYQNLFSVPRAAAARELAELTARNVLDRRSRTRGTHYVLVDPKGN